MAERLGKLRELCVLCVLCVLFGSWFGIWVPPDLEPQRHEDTEIGPDPNLVALWFTWLLGSFLTAESAKSAENQANFLCDLCVPCG